MFGKNISHLNLKIVAILDLIFFGWVLYNIFPTFEILRYTPLLIAISYLVNAILLFKGKPSAIPLQIVLSIIASLFILFILVFALTISGWTSWAMINFAIFLINTYIFVSFLKLILKKNNKF